MSGRWNCILCLGNGLIGQGILVSVDSLSVNVGWIKGASCCRLRLLRERGWCDFSVCWVMWWTIMESIRIVLFYYYSQAILLMVFLMKMTKMYCYRKQVIYALMMILF